MAAPTTKQSSRWGSFLQQAVAGVESRLDTILADVEEEPKLSKPTPAPVASVPAAAKTDSTSRSPSTNNSTNDRLQERLARAIAAKSYASQRSEGHPSRGRSPATLGDRTRPSHEGAPANGGDATGEHDQVAYVSDNGELQPSVSDLGLVEATGLTVEASTIAITPPLSSSDLPNISIESSATTRVPNLPQSASKSQVAFDLQTSTHGGAPYIPVEISELEQPVPSEMEILDSQRDEEIHRYIERIDALQAKLQYLSREAAEAARKVSSAVPSGSQEKILAEKDEQIALLLEEGQKLSKKEMMYMATIKKLRAKTSEFDTEAVQIRARLENADRENVAMQDRLRRAESHERLATERHKLMLQLQRDIEVIKSERDSNSTTISRLQLQLVESSAQANGVEVRAIQELLNNEKKRTTELQNELSTSISEKELAAIKAKAQIDELRAKNEREAERARIFEIELKGEQRMLESRLEVMRARAEEVSSGAIGDAQAKLLRQIETLQTQYAIASENWQGIEASLTSRVTSLEKERDDALKREADVRRRAREVTVKIKENEDELESTRIKVEGYQRELAVQKEFREKQQQCTEQAEAAVKGLQLKYDQDRISWNEQIQRYIDAEKVKWREDISGQPSFGHPRAESPVPPTRRGLTAEYLGLQNLQARRTSSRSITNDLPGLSSRPSSARLVHSNGNGIPHRQDSTQSLLTSGDLSETHSFHGLDNDEYFENITSPGDISRTHDLVSVSTAGAGPSVQLIERMSAAVRRLESEKLSSREEITRLSGQRDEARAEIIALMREVETKRGDHTKVLELEKEVTRINARYQTTLEMLGEKAELVEELQADVEDVKTMYRELVERTVK